MKKRINHILGWGLLIVAGAAFSGCLKNNKYYIDYGAVGTLVELPMAAPTANLPPNIMPGGYDITDYGAYTDTVTYVGDTIGMPVYVNVASPDVPGSPTTATLALDQNALDSINGVFGGVFAGYTTQSGYGPNNYSAGWQYDGNPITNLTYEALPDSCYSVASWTVTVPAGQRLAPLWVTITPSKIDTTTAMYVDSQNDTIRALNHNYILPVTIASASQKVSNWNTVLVNVQVVSPSSYSYPQY